MIFVALVYVLAITAGVTVYYSDTTEKKIHYEIFKGVIPFVIALPAAYLGYCFQRRTAYQKSLLTLWTNLINSVNGAMQYTTKRQTTLDDYLTVTNALLKCIDEVSGIYRDKKEKANLLIYPFKSLEAILHAIHALGFGELDKEKAIKTTKKIGHHWQNIRSTLLSEFDRPVLTVVDRPYPEE